VIFVCTGCLAAVAIVSPDGSLVEATDTPTCPWCKASHMICHPVLGRAAQEGEPYRLTTMGAEDFYRATRGMGLPGEYGASPDTVAQMLKYGKVLALDVEPVGVPPKTVVHSMLLGFPDGGRFALHFGPSTSGAVIYRVEEIREGDHGGTGEDRVQAGPDPVAPQAQPGGGDASDDSGDGLPSL